MTVTNEEIMTELKALRAMVDALLSGMPLASISEITGKYGDPELRFDVKDVGMATKGKKMSQLPAAVLDRVAHMFDFFAETADREGKTYNGKPEAPRNRKDAARARRWALRRRMGWKPEGETGVAPTPTASPFGAVTPFAGASPFTATLTHASGADALADDEEDALADIDDDFADAPFG